MSILFKKMGEDDVGPTNFCLNSMEGILHVVKSTNLRKQQFHDKTVSRSILTSSSDVFPIFKLKDFRLF